MNSERRHELQHNVLADYLSKINESIEPHSKLIAFVVGGVIIGALGLALYRSNASGQRSDATLQLVLAAGEGDAEVLGMVGENYAQTTAGSWARLYQADELMARGVRVLYTDRTEATELFASAKNAYQQALSTSSDKVLESRAHFGLARIAESAGDIDTAITEYRSTIAANESEAMAEIAQQRIESLSRPSTKDFLAWFGDQDFTPSDPSLPPSLPSGTSLPDLPDLDLPPLNLPDLGDGSTGAASEMKAGVSTEDEPAGAEALGLPNSGLEMPADTAAAEPKAAEKSGSKPAKAAEKSDAKPAKAEAKAGNAEKEESAPEPVSDKADEAAPASDESP